MVDQPTTPSSGGASSTIVNGSSEKRTEEESSTTTSIIAGVEKIMIDQPSQLVENGATSPEQPGDNDGSDAEPNDNGAEKKVLVLFYVTCCIGTYAHINFPLVSYILLLLQLSI